MNFLMQLTIKKIKVRENFKNLIVFRFLILIINLKGNNSKMTLSNKTVLLVKILKDDIEKLKVGFQENGIEFSEKDYIYSVNFNLFIELTKEFCFENKTETVYRPTSIISPDTESKLAPITFIPVPEERLQLFKDVILINFDEKYIYSMSYFRLTRSGTYNRKELYYRFFYALCHETFWQTNEIEEVFNSLLEQWNRALEHNKMTVDLFLPLDSISVKGSAIITIEDKFQVGHISGVIVEMTANGIDDWRFYTSIISCKAELLTKIHTSDTSGDPTNKDEKDKYELQYQEAFKELHLLVNAFYINEFDFRWRSPVIKLPWWFDPELYNFKDLQRQQHVDKFLKKEVIDKISTMYSELKKSNIIEKDRVILNGYYRIFQHGMIDAYFIIDTTTFLEALYTKGSRDYVKLRFRLNAASILAKYRKKFWKVYNFLGKMYDIRSNAVHGSNWMMEFEEYVRKRYYVKEGDITSVIIRFRKEFISYLNFSLMYIIKSMNKNTEILKEMNKDPLYFFNNSKLTSVEKNRKEILKELKQRYEKSKYVYENQWEELRALFNIKVNS
ncbi:hypothetical protein LCGC14_0668220 [marine sediment metagenome]|uniref:Apea-like HEPN domain-containing protein n=1 Tax=marine sediment metagenome TaxID=412755 RepID=A0A0F9RBW2_9ZZZZ